MNRTEYKNVLNRLDKDARRCILYLEGLIEDKFKLALKVKQPQAPKVDFSKLESKDDSLQKQINGLREKIDVAYSHAKNHDNDIIFSKTLIKKMNGVLDMVTELFQGLYDSGYFKEGKRREIRDLGLIKLKKKKPGDSDA